MKTFLGFIVAVLALVLLASPFLLVVMFPAVDQAIADTSRSAYPWVVVLLLFAIFNQGVQQVLIEFARFLSRVRRATAGGASVDLDQPGTIQLSPDQAEELRAHITSLDQQSQTSSQLLRTYFLKYVLVTIYGSQFELLSDLLNSGAKTTSQILEYYARFVRRAPDDTTYEFGDWLSYLTSNVLIQNTPDGNGYDITEAGKLFVQSFNEYSYDPSQLRY